jgi:DNA-binding transcriptional ArsR family regulator
MFAYQKSLRSELLSAIAHQNRIKILEQLRKQRSAVGELAAYLEMEQSNLSRHLKLLHNAGIVTTIKEGNKTIYRIADERIFIILDLASEITRQQTEQRLRTVRESL